MNAFLNFGNVMVNMNDWLFLKVKEDRIEVKDFGKAGDSILVGMSKEGMIEQVKNFVDNKVRSDHFVFLNNVLVNLYKLALVETIESIHTSDAYRKYDYIKFKQGNSTRELNLDNINEQELFLNDLTKYIMNILG